MKNYFKIITAILLGTALSACSLPERGAPLDAAAPLAAQRALEQPGVEQRLLIRKASLTIETDDVRAIAGKAQELTKAVGGYVESSSTYHEGQSFFLALRVPDARFENFLDDLSKLGKVKDKSASAQDVTEEVIDAEARLKNLVVTRDRLRKLLERTADVKDVIAVERELSRVQGEIESLEARLKRLRSQVQLSTVNLRIERRMILGPLGYLSWTLWWGLSKLFVIR